MLLPTLVDLFMFHVFDSKFAFKAFGDSFSKFFLLSKLAMPDWFFASTLLASQPLFLICSVLILFKAEAAVTLCKNKKIAILAQLQP